MITPQRSAALALGAACVLLPAAQLLPVDIDRAAGLLFLLGYWLTLRIPAPTPTRATRWIGGLLLGWLAWALLGTSWSSHVAYSLIGLSVLLLALGVGAAALRILKTGDETTGRILLGSLAIGSMLGMSLVCWRLNAPGGGPANVYSHLRLFGLHQGIGGLAGTAWLLLATSRREQLFAIAITMVSWTGVFWAGGRAPMLALAVAGLLWILIGVTPRIRAIIAWFSCCVLGMLLYRPLYQNPRPKWAGTGQ